jgi:SAM-dependent methyltransferase
LPEKERWENSWSKFKKSEGFGSATYPLGFISKMGYESAKKGLIEVIKETNLGKNSKIIDIGCGEGRTLSYFFDYGFKSVVGVDVSKSAISVCESKGLVKNKSVFVMDAKKLRFKDKAFDMVFAEGFLEHFRDFTPFAKEFARVSRRYILITQPNHFSVTGVVLNYVVPKIQKDCVKEYDYRMSDFIEAFEKLGFKIIARRGVHLGQLGKDLDTANILLFERAAGKKRI